MIEYWAVIGLACVDGEFRKKLEINKEDASKIDQLMKEYGFRLRFYELGEVQRLMRIPEIVKSMETIYDKEWSKKSICLTAKTFNPAYLHPREATSEEAARGEGEIILSPVVPASPNEIRFVTKR